MIVSCQRRTPQFLYSNILCVSYRWHSQPNFLFNKNKQNNSIYLSCNLVLCNLSDSCLVYSVLCHTLHFHIHHGDTDKLGQTTLSLSCEWKAHLLKKLWWCLDREQKQKNFKTALRLSTLGWFKITHPINPWIVLHSILLPLLIIVIIIIIMNVLFSITIITITINNNNIIIIHFYFENFSSLLL